MEGGWGVNVCVLFTYTHNSNIRGGGEAYCLLMECLPCFRVMFMYDYMFFE